MVPSVLRSSTRGCVLAWACLTMLTAPVPAEPPAATAVADLTPITDEQRAILQRIAWNAVTRSPVSGVKAAPAKP